MRESRFRKEIRAGITALGGHAEPIESHEVSAGVPDLNYHISGVENWVELKVWTKKNRGALRPTQVKWFRKRLKQGASPALVCMIEEASIVIVTGPAMLTLSGRTTKEQWESAAKWKLQTIAELCDLIKENPSLVTC